VETVCDRVAIINQGQLKEEGPVAQLTARHGVGLEQIFLNIVGYQPQAAL
jgi:ABC-type multidrug transport system ATPase subunit